MTNKQKGLFLTLSDDINSNELQDLTNAAFLLKKVSRVEFIERTHALDKIGYFELKIIIDALKAYKKADLPDWDKDAMWHIKLVYDKIDSTLACLKEYLGEKDDG